MKPLYAGNAVLDHHTVCPNVPVVFLLLRGKFRIRIFLAFPEFLERYYQAIVYIQNPCRFPDNQVDPKHVFLKLIMARIEFF